MEKKIIEKQRLRYMRNGDLLFYTGSGDSFRCGGLIALAGLG
jgi:hypothetical protein